MTHDPYSLDFDQTQAWLQTMLDSHVRVCVYGRPDDAGNPVRRAVFDGVLAGKDWHDASGDRVSLLVIVKPDDLEASPATVLVDRAAFKRGRFDLHGEFGVDLLLELDDGTVGLSFPRRSASVRTIDDYLET